MSISLPSLNSLRAFEVVSRHLNYHSAATELHVTAAAVKQLVSKLEANAGYKLVERKGQGLALTPRGKACCSDLSVAMEYLSSAVKKMQQEKRANQLIVTVETSFATAWLVPKLEQFRRLHPDISVLVDSTQNIVDLDQQQVDVAIRYGVEKHRDLVSHRLFADQIFPACSPAMAEGPPELKTLADLNAVTLIHWDMSHLDWVRETKKWFSWERWLAHIGFKEVNTQGGILFSDYGLAIQAAIAGQGMILASWPILREPIESGLLVCPFEERVTTNIGYDLVTTRERQNVPEVRAFTRWVLDTISSEQQAIYGSKDPATIAC